MYTAQFIADCRKTGAQDFANVGCDGDIPTVEELIAENLDNEAILQAGADFWPEVQAQGLRAWAEAWVAAAEADALRAGDDNGDDD